MTDLGQKIDEAAKDLLTQYSKKLTEEEIEKIKKEAYEKGVQESTNTNKKEIQTLQAKFEELRPALKEPSIKKTELEDLLKENEHSLIEKYKKNDEEKSLKIHELEKELEQYKTEKSDQFKRQQFIDKYIRNWPGVCAVFGLETAIAAYPLHKTYFSEMLDPGKFPLPLKTPIIGMLCGTIYGTLYGITNYFVNDLNNNTNWSKDEKLSHTALYPFFSSIGGALGGFLFSLLGSPTAAEIGIYLGTATSIGIWAQMSHRKSHF